MAKKRKPMTGAALGNDPEQWPTRFYDLFVRLDPAVATVSAGPLWLCGARPSKHRDAIERAP